jgi:hypothetical protein
MMGFMSHDLSLPRGDRCDAPDAPDAEDGALPPRTAFVVSLPHYAEYFQKWCPKGRFVATRDIQRAAIYSATIKDPLHKTIARLDRMGVACSAVEVKIVAGNVERK